MPTSVRSAVELLLVEDNPADVLLTRRALDESEWDTVVSVASSGVAALTRLRDGTRQRPDLIVLDVDLPGLDGHEVLQAIRDDELTALPVVMFSGSGSRDDVTASYRGHANCHVVKPLDLDRYASAVKAIETFWLTIAELPPA